MLLSRRKLVKNGMLVVSGGMLMPAIFSRGIASANELVKINERTALAAANRTLIVVQMAGGNDGLNTVIPYTDGTYRQKRPSLAVPEAQVLKLDGRLGLHPNLAPLKTFWDQGNLAVVESVGYPDQSLSHFEAMDVWQTLDPKQGREGWLGKMVSGLVDQDGHPFKALDIASQTNPALQTLSMPVPTMQNTQSYRLSIDPADQADQGNARMQALMKLYNTYPKSSPYAALLDSTAVSTVEGIRQLREAESAYKPLVTYPNNGFANGLKVLAMAIVEDLGLRVGYVTIGGFDTHAGQKGRHDQLMKQLADGLSAFYNDLAQHGKADDVVIMTWSEFGRRVEENGSQGTDHGTAAPLFIMGNSVNQGIYGEPPELANLDRSGNLKHAVDFRSVYATVLDRWMGASSKDVLGNTFDPHNFLTPM